MIQNQEIFKRIRAFPIRDAVITFQQEVVIVEGITSSWHTKQLVSHEIMSLGLKIDNQLKVARQ